MEPGKDTYRTIAGPAEAVYTERGSRFLAYAWPVRTTEEIKAHTEALRKRYYDATHHCYAYRLGPCGEIFRANDDGEPSGTAGRPILGQLLAAQLTDCLVVVVRYFGGTKLGVPGLINAYRTAAGMVLDTAQTVERTVDAGAVAEFSYLSMNAVMRIVKQFQPIILTQEFDNLCRMEFRIRKSLFEPFIEKLKTVEGLRLETVSSETDG